MLSIRRGGRYPDLDPEVRGQAAPAGGRGILGRAVEPHGKHAVRVRHRGGVNGRARHHEITNAGGIPGTGPGGHPMSRPRIRLPQAEMPHDRDLCVSGNIQREEKRGEQKAGQIHLLIIYRNKD
jgi:hypothetical protein